MNNQVPKVANGVSSVAVVIGCIVLSCLFVPEGQARRVTCPRCGGSGVIPGPVIHGIQSYYGCPDCGGSGGGGAPGTPGRGWIEVPDSPQENNPPTGNSDLQAQQEQARREAEAAKAAEVAKAAEAERLKREQFERDKQDASKNLKSAADTDFDGQLKGTSPADDSGLKGLDDERTLFSKPTPDSTPVDTRVQGPSKLDVSTTPVALPTVEPMRGASSATEIPPEARTPEGDRDFLLALFPAEERKEIFPKNPNPPLINPLREPERYEAWRKATEARLQAAISENKAREVIRAMASDPGLSQARDRIIREEATAIDKAWGRLFGEAKAAFQTLDKKYGVNNGLESLGRQQIDPDYRRDIQALVDGFYKSFSDAKMAIRGRSLEEMQAAVKKFSQDHPELDLGKGQ